MPRAKAHTGSSPAPGIEVEYCRARPIGASLRYLEVAPAPAEVRALVTVGLLGAFTTFSTFSYEIVALLEDGAFGRTLGSSPGSLLLGIVAAYAGMSATGLIVHVRG